MVAALALTRSRPARRGKDARNGSVDYLRLVAAYGIALFHMKAPLGEVGYAGLSVFAALLGYFAAGRLRDDTGRASMTLQARHLAVIWIGWSAFYGATKLADALLAGQGPEAEFRPWMLATGPAIHLWFLPFAAAILAGLAAFVPKARPSSLGAFGAIAAGVVVVALVSSIVAPMLPVPFLQWAGVLPALLFGLLLRLAGQDRGRFLLVALALVIVVLSGAAAGHGTEVARLAGSLLAIGAALQLRLPQSIASELARRLSLGVYILHPLVFALALRVGELARDETALTLVVLSVTTVAAYGLLRSPLRNWIG